MFSLFEKILVPELDGFPCHPDPARGGSYPATI